MRTWMWKRQAVFLCLMLMCAARELRSQEGPGGTLSPYFLLQGDGSSLDDFPLKSTQVVASVSGVIADVLVTQTYSNEGMTPINARYVFPGSTSASIHGMKITIGGQVVVAKIKERQQAKKEFDTAKSQGKSASLLEQHRPNVFSMSVANILPRDVVEVELHYTELLVPTDGTYQFVYPAVVGPRYSSRPAASAPDAGKWLASPTLHEREVPPGKFDIRVTLSTGIPLREVHCPSHEVDVAWDSQAVARVALANGADFGGNRDFILSYRLIGKEIQSGLLLYEGAGENFFLLMVQPPEHVRTADIPPREYIFVLDVSGSMDGFPLETAKELIRDLIEHLRETDRFNVVLFAGDSRVMAPSSQAATAENVRSAFRMIEQQGGGGGTELVPALRTALALPRDEQFSRTVVVITDGFIDAEEETFDVIQQNLSRTNFFSFGIGSGVNRYLLEGIAKAGMGEPFVVTKPEEAPSTAERFREYIDSPVLTKLQVDYNGFDAYDVEPPALPDLFAQRPVILFGKWRGSRGGAIEVSGMGGGGAYTRRFELSETEPLGENGSLRYLWARARIARLSDFNFGKPSEDEIGQVTSLGLNYSLLTRYTSFIAVLEQVRNPEANAKDVCQPLPLPQGVSDLAVAGDYAAGPEPELWALLTLLALLMALVSLARRWRLAGRC
jgi:Ca-activated chloride channel homolog